MTDPLALEPDGADWRLRCNGDWSLTALPRIEAQLKSLPALHGHSGLRLVEVRTPGIGPAWALLAPDCAEAAPDFDVRHSGDPPHYLELLQKTP